MKLSDSLLDLADRVKRVEDSAAAVQTRNQTALQARRKELEAAIEHEVTEIENATAQAAGAAHNLWSDIKKSVENQVSEMRADFEKWQAEVKEKNADRAADDAEWAVVRAELARGEAEKLAAKG